jgi:uncharacterized membrane protein YfcA
MSITLISLIGLILFFCSTIQGAVGFAFNIFAIPLLIWSGLSLPQAITVTSIPIFMQSLTSTYKLRTYVKWKEVAIGTLFRYIGLPLGIYLLTLINSFDKNDIKQVVGVVILLIVALQSLFKVEPKEKVGWFWTVVSFLSSGLFLGMISMGGPPVILWVMAHRWSALEIRAFLSALFFIASPFLLGLLYYNFGKELLDYFITGLSFTPVVVLGTLLGVKLGNRLNHKKLKKIVMGLLVLTSVVSIISPYFK